MTDKCRYDFSSCLLSGLVLIHDVHLVTPMLETQLSMNGWLAGWCVCTCGMAGYGWCVCVCRCGMAGYGWCVCVGVKWLAGWCVCVCGCGMSMPKMPLWIVLTTRPY